MQSFTTCEPARASASGQQDNASASASDHFLTLQEGRLCAGCRQATLAMLWQAQRPRPWLLLLALTCVLVAVRAYGAAWLQG